MDSTPAGKENISLSRSLFHLLRPRQWLKNGFVLAPLLFAGQLTHLAALQQALLAALLFCAAASATYIVNDWKDIERDRQHPKKRFTRPLAAGTISKNQALLVLIALYGFLAWGYSQQPQVVAVIAGYLLLNLAYSFGLKHQPVVDIFTIAIGFVLRVWAGAVALNVPLSSWMFVTSLCLALYLAAIKRRQELLASGSDSREVLQKYSVALIDRYAEMAATGALLFYSLYVMSAQPELIATIPLVLFGLFRYWFVVETQDAGESPTDALIKDWQLIATIAAWIGLCAWVLAI